VVPTSRPESRREAARGKKAFATFMR